MLLEFAEQVSFTNIRDEEFDIFITSSGYETRATKLANNIKAKRKVVFSFDSHINHEQRISNDEIFKLLQFDEFILSGDDHARIIHILDSIIIQFSIKKNFKVLVDYSCMTKVWYSTILNYFLNKDLELDEMEIYFSYTPSKYSIPQPPMPNAYMGPIPGFFRVSTSSKPTALILGLGYEKNTAKGLVEYLDPKETFVFYSKPAFDERFAKDVEKNNSDLLNSLKRTNIYPHPISNLKDTDDLLTSLCLVLRNRFRIILAPLGPKPFALLCMLVACKLSDIDVWRVTSGGSGNVYDRPPADLNPVICKASFIEERILELT